MSLRTRWLIISGALFLWLFAFSSVRLIGVGYGIHHGLWWLTWATVSAAVSVTMGWIAVFSNRQIIATQREAIAGLDEQQYQQARRIWKPGPIPADPTVLIAVLRLHNLSEVYRRRTLRVRFILAVVVGVRSFAVILLDAGSHGYLAISLNVVFWAACLLTLFWPDIRAKRRQSRLLQLRAAADQDPDVAAAVAEAITPAPKPRWWWIAIVLVVALVYGLALGAAYDLSPRERSCRAAHAAMYAIYSNRGWYWNTNIGPGARPLSDYQLMAQQLHDKATATADFPRITPHAQRIAELADHAATVVGDTRQQSAPDPDTLAHNQTDYARTLDAIAAEEKILRQACSPNILVL